MKKNRESLQSLKDSIIVAHFWDTWVQEGEQRQSIKNVSKEIAENFTNLWKNINI